MLEMLTLEDAVDVAGVADVVVVVAGFFVSVGAALSPSPHPEMTSTDRAKPIARIFFMFQ